MVAVTASRPLIGSRVSLTRYAQSLAKNDITLLRSWPAHAAQKSVTALMFACSAADGPAASRNAGANVAAAPRAVTEKKVRRLVLVIAAPRELPSEFLR